MTATNNKELQVNDCVKVHRFDWGGYCEEGQYRWDK